MLRIAKLTDYATVILSHMAVAPQQAATATDLAVRLHLAQPTVSKVLKALAQGGLLSSRRGAHGGYRLARDAASISMADVIEVMEGPVSLTECSTASGDCCIQAHCSVRNHWQVLNSAVAKALSDVSVADMLPVSRPAAAPLP